MQPLNPSESEESQKKFERFLSQLSAKDDLPDLLQEREKAIEMLKLLLDTRGNDEDAVYNALVALSPGNWETRFHNLIVDFIRWERDEKAAKNRLANGKEWDGVARISDFNETALDRHSVMFGTGGDSGPLASLEDLLNAINDPELKLVNKQALISKLEEYVAENGWYTYLNKNDKNDKNRADRTIHISTTATAIAARFLKENFYAEHPDTEHIMTCSKVGTGGVTGESGSTDIRGFIAGNPPKAPGYLPEGSVYCSVGDLIDAEYSPVLVEARQRLHENHIDDPYKCFFPIANLSNAEHQVTGFTKFAYLKHGMEIADHIATESQCFVYNVNTGCDEAMPGANIVVWRNQDGGWEADLLEFGKPKDQEFQESVKASWTNYIQFSPKKGQSQESANAAGNETVAAARIFAGNVPGSLLETISMNAAIAIQPAIEAILGKEHELSHWPPLMLAAEITQYAQSHPTKQDLVKIGIVARNGPNRLL